MSLLKQRRKLCTVYHSYSSNQNIQHSDSMQIKPYYSTHNCPVRPVGPIDSLRSLHVHDVFHSGICLSVLYLSNNNMELNVKVHCKDFFVCLKQTPLYNPYYKLSSSPSGIDHNLPLHFLSKNKPPNRRNLSCLFFLFNVETNGINLSVLCIANQNNNLLWPF